MRTKRIAASAAAGTAVLLAAVTGCAALGESGPSIVVYNAQHEQLISELAPAFEDQTGVRVELRNGSDSDLAAQLVQEGDASPADVFLTENSPAMSAVERAGLLAPLSSDALDPVPAQFRPGSGEWTGFAARETVLAYNPDLVAETDLPRSIMDLASPTWADQVAFPPNGADFQAIVAAVLDLRGEDATRAWLAGLRSNGVVFDSNPAVLEAVSSGEVPMGIIYHYYWARDRAENGGTSDGAELHYFGNQDPGAFLSVSGAGVLASSEHQADAQRFVAFLTSRAGQQDLADSYALEYPLNPAVSPDPSLKPLAELDPPVVQVSDLDNQKVVEMMTEAGFL